MINALDLEVPRALQTEAVKQKSDLEPTEGQQTQALRAFTTIATAHARRAAGSRMGDYQERRPIRRSLVNAESQELACRRMDMLKEDQKKLKATRTCAIVQKLKNWMTIAHT